MSTHRERVRIKSTLIFIIVIDLYVSRVLYYITSHEYGVQKGKTRQMAAQAIATATAAQHHHHQHCFVYIVDILCEWGKRPLSTLTQVHRTPFYRSHIFVCSFYVHRHTHIILCVNGSIYTYVVMYLMKKKTYIIVINSLPLTAPFGMDTREKPGLTSIK